VLGTQRANIDIDKGDKGAQVLAPVSLT
jgi:hypothetical protein